MPTSDPDLESVFPELKSSGYKITSPFDINYNCIAWAVGENKKCWWPDPNGQYYWPDKVQNDNSTEAFIEMFRIFGYEVCDTDKYEKGYEKIAIFAKSSGPTHAARQLKSGKWTSKLGQDKDIEHILESLNSNLYGEVVCIMRRSSK